MLNENYAECLVPRKKTSSAFLIKIVLGIGVLLSAGSILLIGLYGFILLLLMGAFAVSTVQKLNVEYEYLLVEKVFSVDRIYNRTRRKRAAEYTLEDIVLIAPEHSDRFTEYERQVKKITDFTSGDPGAVRYAFLYTKSGAGEKVLFEPDERMIRCFKQMAPRKFIELRG